MNGLIPPAADLPATAESEALERAQIYQFFEMSFAHPWEYGFAFFRREAVIQAFVSQFADFMHAGGEVGTKGLIAANNFLSCIRRMGFEEMESAHAALFPRNCGYLPCSSYRSFVATADSENDVKEMRAIKSFCLRQGMDIAGSLDDLSDCLCIELKFMRVQCFREHDAAIHGNAERKASLQAVEAEFLGRFLTPFTSRLADIDIQSNPTSPYSHLLEALRHFVSHHFMEFEAMTREPAVS
jgi:TorA maturation chaperone TorD